jgi:antiviral helicase SLH1
MAATNLSSAESQWRAQFEAMKAALAELKLPPSSEIGSIHTELDDVYDEYSSASGQDIWDFISDDEVDDSYFSDEAPALVSDGYGTEWLASKCSIIAAKTDISAEAFQAQIEEILASGRTEDDLQSQLTDLIGFEDLDFVIELIAHRAEINGAVAMEHQQESSGRRLLNKAEREDKLRRQDYEHKTAALLPNFSKEERYPHVYQSYSAGNKLSSIGKKYALPEGSKHQHFEKYEQHSIPAGPKGTLAPGQKLVKISDLDGLCRNTFKGYKSLNRMQSLVYPVAYKTSENMLICAPTGAVSAKIINGRLYRLPKLTSPGKN